RLPADGRDTCHGFHHRSRGLLADAGGVDRRAGCSRDGGPSRNWHGLGNRDPYFGCDVLGSGGHCFVSTRLRRWSRCIIHPGLGALLNPGVWIAAYGQIFFSLTVGFGIMITYSSYLKKRTNLTGSGLVVGFSNSGFEILAGIGVFSALGFMAQTAGVHIEEVVSSGIGLAFVAFPEIISQAPLGLGPII